MNSDQQLQLSVIVPTYNERESIGALIDSVRPVLDGLAWELIVVDDNSPDGTADYVRQLAGSNPRLRCIQRIGRRGLASAVIEGCLATTAKHVAVIDADGQHDERLLSQMHQILQRDEADMVIASRFMEAASTGSLAAARVGMSRFANRLASFFVKQKTTDPMSGFFMFQRSVMAPVFEKLSARGFKVLLDMMVSAGPELRIAELPYVMRSRTQGESKLDMAVALELSLFLVDKLVGHWIPLRFVMFVAVGLTGVVVHSGVLFIAHQQLAYPFLPAQVAATIIAMTSNFLINNVFTYRDRRLHGTHLLRGLLFFYAACSVGALINIQFANYIYEYSGAWLLAGISGAAVGAVWNYAMTKTFTWNSRE